MSLLALKSRDFLQGLSDWRTERHGGYMSWLIQIGCLVTEGIRELWDWRPKSWFWKERPWRGWCLTHASELISMDGVVKLPAIWELWVHFCVFLILRELGVVWGCVCVYSLVGSSQGFDSSIFYQEGVVVFPWMSWCILLRITNIYSFSLLLLQCYELS